MTGVPHNIFVAAVVAALAASGASAQAPPRSSGEPNWLTLDEVVMQGLDKVTARVSTFDAPVGKTVRFGSLEITARTCRKRPPEETPESAAFVDIRDAKPGENPVLVFSGWMFASSPALSSLEHPVYDVWVIDCRNVASSSSPSSK
jgi:hypothetical protein